MKTLVVTMAKLDSQRASFKMLRPIDGETLFERSLKFIEALGGVDSKWCFVRNEKLKSLASQYSLDLLPRSLESTTASTFYDIWSAVGEKAKQEGFDAVVWINGCCPFIQEETVYKAIKQFEQRGDKSQVLLPVLKQECAYWDSKGNSIAKRDAPNRQDSQSHYGLSHMFWIRTPEQILNCKEIEQYQSQHESAVLFEITNKIEAIDVDDEQDFLIAQALSSYLSLDALCAKGGQRSE